MQSGAAAPGFLIGFGTFITSLGDIDQKAKNFGIGQKLDAWIIWPHQPIATEKGLNGICRNDLPVLKLFGAAKNGGVIK